jgi:hypothetical protein
MCPPSQADIAKTAEHIWPWLRGLLNEPRLPWSEILTDPKHAPLREIAEQLAEAALEAAPCPNGTVRGDRS